MNNMYKRQIRPMYYSPGCQGFSDTYDPIIYKGEEWHDESKIEEIKKALEPVIRDKDSWGSLKFDERFVAVDKYLKKGGTKMNMSLEDAKRCLSSEGCHGCKYNDQPEIDCRGAALEIAEAAINYMMIGKKLSHEIEEKTTK